jgi:hypothetical protein
MKRTRDQAYVGTTKRTFRHALINRLKTDYGLLGSDRILNLLAEDVQLLVDEFYPPMDRVSPGWMSFTGVKADDRKPYPGQSAADHELVTISWPVLVAEDIQELTRCTNKAHWRKLLEKRLARIIEHGWQHPRGPVLLTLADLGAIISIKETSIVSKLLKLARESTGKPLLTKGLYFDQGVRPTHKKEIIELYEKGDDEVDIARKTSHSLDSVGHYIRDYERVKLLLKKSITVVQISRLIQMQSSVVQAYVKMVEKYHPEIKIIFKDQQKNT